MDRDKKLAAIQRSNHETDIAFRDTFTNPAGKVVLDNLDSLFNPERLTGADAYITTARAHQSDVIRFIHRRIEDGMDG
jgi:hypothetical protein